MQKIWVFKIGCLIITCTPYQHLHDTLTNRLSGIPTELQGTNLQKSPRARRWVPKYDENRPSQRQKQNIYNFSDQSYSDWQGVVHTLWQRDQTQNRAQLSVPTFPELWSRIELLAPANARWSTKPVILQWSTTKLHERRMDWPKQ